MQSESQTGNTGDIRLRGPQFGAGEPFLQGDTRLRDPHPRAKAPRSIRGDTRLRDPHSEVIDLADKGTPESIFSVENRAAEWGVWAPFLVNYIEQNRDHQPGQGRNPSSNNAGFFWFYPAPSHL